MSLGRKGLISPAAQPPHRAQLWPLMNSPALMEGAWAQPHMGGSGLGVGAVLPSPCASRLPGHHTTPTAMSAPCSAVPPPPSCLLCPQLSLPAPFTCDAMHACCLAPGWLCRAQLCARVRARCCLTSVHTPACVCMFARPATRCMHARTPSIPKLLAGSKQRTQRMRPSSP